MVVREGIERVTVTGGPFRAIPYTCRFGSVPTVGVYVSESSIICDTPVIPSFPAGVYTLSTNLSIYYNNAPYAPTTVPVTFYGTRLCFIQLFNPYLTLHALQIATSPA